MVYMKGHVFCDVGGMKTSVMLLEMQPQCLCVYGNFHHLKVLT